MMRGSWMVVMLLVCAPVAADELAAEGAELYAEFCASCHGDDAEGVQPFADSAEGFVARLEGETDNMPDFTDFFDPEEVEAMYHFLTTTTGTD